MRNLTEIFKKTISSNADWRFSDFYNVIDLLNKAKIETSFWEDEENWASIIYQNEIVGYIWKIHPLIIFEKDKLTNINGLLADISSINYI